MKKLTLQCYCIVKNKGQGLANDITLQTDFTSGHNNEVPVNFDMGQNPFTPEIIRDLYGENVVMINNRHPDYADNMRAALASARDLNGAPMNFPENTIEQVVYEGSRIPAAMLGEQMEQGIIVYNPDELLRINTPEGWRDYAIDTPDISPESFEGMASHSHPTLMMNMSLMTEISHHQWHTAMQERLKPQQFEEWLSNPENADNPTFKKYIEMGLDEKGAALNALMEEQETDEIRMEIRGDSDAMKWTTQWAEEHGRPDIAEAAQDFRALRIAGPMTRWVSSLGTSQNMRHGIEYSPEEKEKQFMMQDDIKEDVVAGIGSLLEDQPGLSITTLDDINEINMTILKAGAILTEHMAQNVEFAEGMPIEEALESGQAFNPSMQDIHSVIAKIHQTGELPELPESVGPHILPATEAEAAMIKDVLRAYGVAIERSMPNEVPQTITSDLGKGNWGIDNADQHWSFDNQEAELTATDTAPKSQPSAIVQP